MNQVLDTLIVGAGISGLSLAHALRQDQKQILLCERSLRVGGNITTGTGEGFLWEEGPTSFSPTPELLKLAVDVGLKDELVLADRRLPRYVYWQGKLQPVPMSPQAAVTTELLSLQGKLRAAMGALGFVRPTMEAEETVAQFFQRHLGSEVTARLVAPFVSGVYAGDPAQLSASAAFRRIANLADMGGGLVAGAMLLGRQRKKLKMPTDTSIPKTRPGELGSFKEGLSALPKAIASKLGDSIQLGWHLTRLQKSDRQTYIVEFATPTGQQQVEARTIVLTTPAYISAELLQDLAPSASQALREIPYPPVACVVLAYHQTALRQPLRGFGNLIPRGQGIRTLGTIWSSSLFPDRAPQGWQLLTNFIGGASDREIGDLDDEQIVRAVHQDLCRILLKEDVPPKVLAVHLWKRAIPQYTLGHQQRLEQINRDLEQFPGIFPCSNYFDGVALGDCVRRGFERAAEVRQYLHDRATSSSV